MKAGADILAVGMITPVGANAGQTARSVRAGVGRLKESKIMNRHGQPLVFGLLREDHLPRLHETVARSPAATWRRRRTLPIAASALQECLRSAGPTDEVPLYLSVPEPWWGEHETFDASYLTQLASQSGCSFAMTKSHIYPHGRAGGFSALAQAVDSLKSGGSQLALVGGVDSYFDRHLLSALDAEDRLLAEGIMDGFAPGEGAAFLLLGAPGVRGAKPIAHVASVATASEPGHRYSDKPYLGEGLASTFGQVFAGLPPESPQVSTVLAGLNGENFGAKEWTTAYVRSKPHFSDQLQIQHPVDCFGDAGAALGPILIALAALGIDGGYLESPALAWASSDRAWRGAALIQGRDK